MKKYFYLNMIFFFLSFLLFSGCPNHFQMPEKTAVPKGYGTVRISFAGEAWQARTVYPSTNAFDKIEYFFTREGGSAEEKFPENGLFTLETGAWTVEVKAYIDSAHIADGQETFSAGSGSAVNVTITLIPTDDALSGSGTFAYTITFPEDAAITEFNLYNLLSPNNTVNLMPAVMPAGTMFEHTETDIPAGYYLLTLTMTKNGRNSGRNEIVHIYGSMPSAYTVVFEDIDFINTPPTAPENLKAVNGDGKVTLHWDAPRFKASIRTVVVKMCCTSSGWSEDKALRIVVNGVTITDTARADGDSSTYSFPVNPGDIIQFYWLTGSGSTGQTTYSFIAYSEDAPPNPEFTWNNSYTWAGSNALLYRQRSRNAPLGLGNVTNNTLLGSFVVGDESVTGYEVSYSSDDGETWSVPEYAEKSPYTFTGLNNGTNYTFRVSAINDAGPSPAAYSGATPSEPRTVVVDMYSAIGNGWITNVALTIVVDGVQIADNVKVNGVSGLNNPTGQRYFNSYSFDVFQNNFIEFYWNEWSNGSYRYSFIVYYADTPPEPEFYSGLQTGTSFGPTEWYGQNALIFRLRGNNTSSSSETTLNDAATGSVLGAFTAGAPSSPQNFYAVQGDGQAMLSWAAPANSGSYAVTGYQLTHDNWGPNTVTLGANASSYTFTSLTNGQFYIFKIRAINDIGVGSENTVTAVLYDSGRIKKAEFTGDTATVNFDNLSGHDIYLVKINNSSSVVSAANTGGIMGISPSLFQGGPLFNELETELPIIGHPGARELSEKPAPIEEVPPRRQSAFIPPEVGDTRMFWVETSYGSGSYIQKQATLRATGIHSNIWVMDENFTSGSGSGNLISSSQAQVLSDRFDIIYPVATNILGYEYGGGPGGDGGRDGDHKIQILAYYIGSGVAGYFHSKDYSLIHQGSNQAEIFYIDTLNLNNTPPNLMYTAMIHEFQHLICYNMKNIKQGSNPAAWYNEMLSLMAEDIIAPLIGIGTANTSIVISNRMPTYLTNYHRVGITEWGSLSNTNYAKGTAFGAYLMRNYGGPELLRKILHNSPVNIDSITAALNEIQSGTDFYYAFRKFGEAMVFSGSSKPYGAAAFDKTVSSGINGITYTAHGFDIWNDFTQKGPVIFDLTQRELRGYSLTIHSDNTWQNITGAVSITLEKPLDPNVEFYLMAK